MDGSEPSVAGVGLPLSHRTKRKMITTGKEYEDTLRI